MVPMGISSLGRLALLVVVAFECKRAAHSVPTGGAPKPVRAQPDKVTIPALPGEEEGLAFDVETTRLSNPDGRRLRLKLGNGDATLTLFEPNRKAEFAFGHGELLSPSRAGRAALVDAVARWLKERPPAAPAAPGELRPFKFDYVALGSDGTWDANKLFLHDGSQNAEVYL